jgi:tRNA nucleotidyltransferase/poly(A) polymerase
VADRRTLTDGCLVAAARRRLAARRDVRAALAVARKSGEPVLLTGGAVRDAFLATLDPRRKPGPHRDLDLALPAGRALRFAGELAARLGSRAIPIGAPPRRVLRIPLPQGEIDVWERESDSGRDLYRRDFTVNALAFRLPSWDFLAPASALGDLRRRRLSLPRPGVLLEDPLRVLRAARFVAELPGFCLASSAAPELRRAAARLGAVAAERRLVELDALLSAPPRERARALRLLERAGALARLLPGSRTAERRIGISRAARLPGSFPSVARLLLLSPLGARRAGEALRRWKTTRREQQIASRLLALEAPPTARCPAGPPTRREVVAILRLVSPFFEESFLFLSTLQGRRPARLAAALAALVSDPSRRARLLRPRRPLDAVAELRALGVEEGPRLGALLGELDMAVAAGEVRDAAGARKLLAFLAGDAPR